MGGSVTNIAVLCGYEVIDMNQSLEKVVVEKDGKKFTQYRHNLFVIILPEIVTFKEVCLETSDGGIYIKVNSDGKTEILKLVSKNTN